MSREVHVRGTILRRINKKQEEETQATRGGDELRVFGGLKLQSPLAVKFKMAEAMQS